MGLLWVGVPTDEPPLDLPLLFEDPLPLFAVLLVLDDAPVCYGWPVVVEE